MTHLSMEQLLATKAPGLEPGVQSWHEHLTECPQCAEELARLDQRSARLKALPTLRPSRDLFAKVRQETVRVDRTRRIKRWAFGGLALAASITLAVAAFNLTKPERTLYNPDLAEMMDRSTQLEQALNGFDQDRRVVDGRTVALTSSLEDRLARIDRQIEAVGLMERQVQQRETIKLWRERVGLLDALVDVHLTGARYVGF